MLRSIPTVRIPVLALVAGLSILLTACTPGGPVTPEDPSTSASTSDTSGGTTSTTDEGSTAPEVIGTWSGEGKGDPHLTFVDEAGLEGSDGCVGFTTTYTFDGDTVRIDDFVTAQKKCLGVDQWLSKGRSATVEGDVMTVFDAQGAEIGRLERSSSSATPTS